MSVETVTPTTHTRGAARTPRARTSTWPNTIELAGRNAVRYGLVLVLAWIGAMKFTAYEAEAISGLVSNSPLTSWLYAIFSVQQLGILLGLTELFIAVLVATRPIYPRLSAAGSALAIAMFATTLSFLLSTPGVIEPTLGFPAISVMPGQFLIKDVVLLAAALWTLGDSLLAIRHKAA